MTPVPGPDEIAKQVVVDIRTAINSMTRAYTDLHGRPAQWPQLLAQLSELADGLFDHCQHTARQVADYAAAFPPEDDRPLVMLMTDEQYQRLWSQAAGNNHAYGYAVLDEHGDPGLLARCEPVGMGRVVFFCEVGSDWTERVVSLWYGGVDPDTVTADLASRGIQAAESAFVPRSSRGFRMESGAVYDCFGREVTTTGVS